MLLRLLAVGLIATLAATAVAQAPSAWRPFDGGPRKIPAGFEEREQAIEARLGAAPASRWAGRYYQGDGLGENIRLQLAPDAGVTATWTGCLGMYGANHGSVVERDDGALLVHYVASNEPTAFGGFPDVLIPVSWGERQYLIPPDRMSEFVSALNHGFEPQDSREGMFLLRDGDAAKPVAGLPSISPERQAQVRRRAIEARITSVALRERTVRGESCASTYTVDLLTTDEPVTPFFVGEELRTADDYQRARIVAQDGRWARAEIGRNQACDKETAPAVGQRYTTGAYRGK